MGTITAKETGWSGGLTRRVFGQLLTGAAAGLPANPSTPMAAFPYGTHIYREPHLPLDRIRADLPLLKKLGFTMVKIQESWAWDERSEGRIDLSNVARVISDARGHGLGVYFGVTMEQAPAWLWRKHPDAQMVYEDGQPHHDPTPYLLPADGKPGPCWHHPGARAAAVRFLEQAGRELSGFENIEVWNVWQEIGFGPQRAGHLGFCYCRHSLAAFRGWLRQRYEALDRLNAAWQTAFGEWEEVEPPRAFAMVPSMLDWRYFMEDVYFAEALHWKAGAFRREDPRQRPVMAHVGTPAIGRTAEWRWARRVDVFGSSAYPSWGEWGNPDTTEDQRRRTSEEIYRQLWDTILLRFDYVRSASPNGLFWTAELQGGRAGGGVDPGRVPDAADIRRWVLGSIAAGARGLCFWNHRTEPFWSESHGFGLLPLRGEAATERAREAGRIGRALNAQAALFAAGTVPPARVAILLDERLWHFVTSSGSGIRHRYSRALRGLYRALWEDGFPVDFLEGDAVPEDSSLYRALLFPYPICVRRQVAQALKRYVASGGALLADACAGRHDEIGFGVPGEMLADFEEIFGAKHKELFVLPENAPARVMSGAGAFAGLSLGAAHYLQQFSLTDAEPIFTYRGEVTGCAHAYGKGRAYLAGTLLGNGPGDRLRPFLSRVLRQAGVTPDRAGALLRRRRVHGDRAAWFLFNPTREVVEELVSLEDYRSAEDLLGGPLPVEAGRVRVAVEPMDVACLVLRR